MSRHRDYRNLRADDYMYDDYYEDDHGDDGYYGEEGVLYGAEDAVYGAEDAVYGAEDAVYGAEDAYYGDAGEYHGGNDGTTAMGSGGKKANAAPVAVDKYANMSIEDKRIAVMKKVNKHKIHTRKAVAEALDLLGGDVQATIDAILAADAAEEAAAAAAAAAAADASSAQSEAFERDSKSKTAALAPGAGPPGFDGPAASTGSGRGAVSDADMMGLGTMVDSEVRTSAAAAAAAAEAAEAEARAAAAESAAAAAGPSSDTASKGSRSGRLFVRRRTKLNKRIGKEMAEARAAADAGRTPLNLVVVGHVDHGKSTLMGHVLYELKHVSDREFHKYERLSAQQGKGSFAFAWVLDAHEEERERGITMDIAVQCFSTPTKDITLLDAPGHRDYVPNMITGAAQADAAILVVSAAKGEFEAGFQSDGQTKEHVQLLRSLGVRSVIVAVNKMDLIGWDHSRYTTIVTALTRFLKTTGFRSVPFVPLSGLDGVNLVGPANAELAPWYSGPSLLEAVDALAPPDRDIHAPLRMPVTDVYRPSASSGAVVSGKIVTGSVRLDDQVLLQPGGEIHMVKTIIVRDADQTRWADAGANVEIVLREGDTSTLAGVRFLVDPEYPLPMACRFKARIIVLDISTPITKGYPVVLHYHNVNEDAAITRLCRLHPADGSPEAEAYAAKVAAAEAAGLDKIPRRKKPRRLLSGHEATVEITVSRHICLDTFANSKEMGRVMLREAGRTVACGIVTKLYDDAPTQRTPLASEGAPTAF